MCIDDNEFYYFIVQLFIQRAEIACYIDTPKISPFAVKSMIVKYRINRISDEKSQSLFKRVLY